MAACIAVSTAACIAVSTAASIEGALPGWQPPMVFTLTLLLCAALYVRGWSALRRTRATQFPAARAAAFLGGLALLWITVASPLDELADTLFTVHMAQHLLLMSAIPLLLLAGLPVAPLLRGLPRGVVRGALGPLLRMHSLRRLLHALTRTSVAWLAMSLAYLAWHVPAAYDLALAHEPVHQMEHLCFFATSLLFWWTILRPWPAEPRRGAWSPVLYLALADIVMTLLSGFLTFCDRPVYPWYATHPNRFGLAPLDDQVLGAVLMWVIGSFAYLVPALWLTVRLLRPAQPVPWEKGRVRAGAECFKRR